jgi:hypothetical protein
MLALIHRVLAKISALYSAVLEVVFFLLVIRLCCSQRAKHKSGLEREREVSRDYTCLVCFDFCVCGMQKSHMNGVDNDRIFVTMRVLLCRASFGEMADVC